MRHSILETRSCSLKSMLKVSTNSKAVKVYSDGIFLSLSRSDVFVDLILAEGNSSSLSINQSTTFITGPYLEGNGISNVTTQISTHAYLPCRVSTKHYLLDCFYWYCYGANTAYCVSCAHPRVTSFASQIIGKAFGPSRAYSIFYSEKVFLKQISCRRRLLIPNCIIFHEKVSLLLLKHK